VTTVTNSNIFYYHHITTLIPAIKVTEFIFCVKHNINNVAAYYIEMLVSALRFVRSCAILHSQTVFHIL